MKILLIVLTLFVLKFEKLIDTKDLQSANILFIEVIDEELKFDKSIEIIEEQLLNIPTVLLGLESHSIVIIFSPSFSKFNLSL